MGGGGGGVKAKAKKISRFTTDFHSKSSISETKGRRGEKYTFSESSLKRLIQKLMFSGCCCQSNDDIRHQR